MLIGFPGLGDNNTVIPPDTDGAVGPAHLVVALNSQIEIQTRTGTPRGRPRDCGLGDPDWRLAQQRSDGGLEPLPHPIDSTGNFWGDFPTLGCNKN